MSSACGTIRAAGAEKVPTTRAADSGGRPPAIEMIKAMTFSRLRKVRVRLLAGALLASQVPSPREAAPALKKVQGKPAP